MLPPVKHAFYLLLFLVPVIVSSQEIDSLEINTSIVRTRVIRTQKYKLKVIPRGLVNTTPKISFRKVKTLNGEYKKFKKTSFWDKTNHFGLDINESAFSNWNAGGNNSVSATGNLNFVRKYKFRYIQWDNKLDLRYGLNAQENQKLRKTNDELRFGSTFGYRKDTISNWYYSVKAELNTQMTNGYRYPNTETRISRFMAPGYITFGAGSEYSLDKKRFNIYMSPVTFKTTLVLDDDLANAGAFGVEGTEYDTDGNIIKEGKKHRTEFGILITNTWKKEVLENVEMNHRLNLYTDYLRSFGNVDIDWELTFNFKVNKIFTASLGGRMIYDDDVLFDEVRDENDVVIQKGIPKIQLRQSLAIGVSYDF